YGLRYDTEKGPGGEVQIADLSLFGTGKGLSLYTRVNKSNQLFRSVFHSPTLSGLKWKTLMSASYENGELTLQDTNTRSWAEGQRYDFSFQRQRKLIGHFMLLTGYEYERLRTRPLALPQAPMDNFQISRMTGTVLADTRDDPLNTKKGRLVSLDFQVV